MQKRESRKQSSQLWLGCAENLWWRLLFILWTRSHCEVLCRERPVPDLHFRAITLAVVDGQIGGYTSFDSEA